MNKEEILDKMSLNIKIQKAKMEKAQKYYERANMLKADIEVLQKENADLMSAYDDLR
jgi:hypothetical protein